MPATTISGQASLEWTRQLLAVSDVHELLWAALQLLRSHTSYQHGWIGLYSEDRSTIRFLSGVGQASLERLSTAEMIELPTAGDAMLEEFMNDHVPQVVVDARVDPRPHPDRVAAMGNRTIINLPLHVEGRQLGFFSVGTFADEGPIAPTEQDMDNLNMMASHLSVVLSRLRAEERHQQAEEQLRSIRRLEAMGQLAGGVAHDMNNLLTVVLSSVELALLGIDDVDGVTGCLEDIEQAARRASSLSRQLLSFSRRRVLQVRPLNLSATLGDGVVPLLRRVIPSNIEVVVQLPDAPGVVNGDQGQLEQVVMNLVINARDAMPDGGRLVLQTEHVELDARSVEADHAPGAFVVFSVTDTGTGIPSDLLDRVFEPFFSTKGPDAGSGLGLSVVHGIVEQHGGFVRVASAPDRGTRFEVYLPLVSAEVASSPTQPEPRDLGGVGRILVVDDSEGVRRVVSSVLTTAGFDVVEASDGQQALDALQTDADFDLLITDMVMPQLDGRALLDGLADRGLHLPTLVISGYGADGMADDLIAEAGLEVLSKPFGRLDLLQRVHSLLGAH